jgi:hypothetical protein
MADLASGLGGAAEEKSMDPFSAVRDANVPDSDVVVPGPAAIIGANLRKDDRKCMCIETVARIAPVSCPLEG